MNALEQLLAGEQARRPVQVGKVAGAPAWTLDLDAITNAWAAYGLDWPVVVNVVNFRRQRQRGKHYSRRDERRQWFHDVQVRTQLAPERASRVLWHELTHALQCECLGPAVFDVQYEDYGRKGAAYRANPFEIEARAAEARASAQPLVRAL